MVEHTPGPWFVGNAPSHADKVYARRPGDNVRQVAHCEQHGWMEKSADENRANARLIAAAPELLAVAVEWLAIWNSPRNVDRVVATCEILARTEAAIAKAIAEE